MCSYILTLNTDFKTFIIQWRNRQQSVSINTNITVTTVSQITTDFGSTRTNVNDAMYEVENSGGEVGRKQ